jgi:hypothetical protein
MKLRNPLLAVLLALVCACVTLLSTSLTYADGPGNSDAARMCQQGGYLDYTRADGSPFRNVGECVSYAAQGGILRPKCGILSFTQDIVPAGDCGNNPRCWLPGYYTMFVSGQNFPPNTTLTLVVTAPTGVFYWNGYPVSIDFVNWTPLQVTTDASGSFIARVGSGLGRGLGTFTATITEGGCGSVSQVLS